jgi:SAM-dependent methyltransferase
MHDTYAQHANNPIRTFVFLPTFMSLIEGKSFDTVLDLGCGDGACARVMYESGIAEHVSALDTSIEEATNEASFDEIHYGTVSSITTLDTNQTFDCICGANGPNFLLNRMPNVSALRTLLASTKRSTGMFIGVVYNPFLTTSAAQFKVGEDTLLSWESSQDLSDGSTLHVRSADITTDCHWYSSTLIEQLSREVGFSQVQWVQPKLYLGATESEVVAYQSFINTPPFYAFIMQ